MSDLDKMIGKQIKSISKSDDGDELYFLTPNSIVTYSAEGDCCSHSWVESVESPDGLETILEILEKDVSESQQKAAENQYVKENDYVAECLKLYFYEVKTDKGSYTIEMRNESNGYYGGSLEFAGEKSL